MSSLRSGCRAALESASVLVGVILVGASFAGVLPGGAGGLPTWAGEARDGVALELDARWRSFAADLASASGCDVTYQSPLGQSLGTKDPQRRLWDDHGTVGILRIGSAAGPAVLVMPDGFLSCAEASEAYQLSGLREPRRFAQELVEAAAFPGRVSADASDASGRTLAELLQTRAILLPVCVAAGDSGAAKRKPGLRVGDPRRNFPVRWEEAVRKAPEMAGPYPGSHPGVRALTAWLNTTPECAGLLVVGPGSESRIPVGTQQGFAAGSLEAFCSEVLRFGVQGCTAEQSLEAITRGLSACAELAIESPVWTRLGSTNWSLEVTVTRRGMGPGGDGAVLLNASPIDSELRWTAAAAENLESVEHPMELLPLRNQGVLLEGAQRQGGRRVRLFFSGSPGSPVKASTAAMLMVELKATSPQAQHATLRASSPR
ncbi:hypothetical protein Poly30_24260 [Planctomycetes bacterium Poly30]|uniref:Uncharacterized protein n=1 Tax=Saltatorellus ferox TaxID=2528018 RepID=A0A518ES36_9BACT|nr:hypothetical protein Poly30_24260 [Planctomycetes bacterium Poly30]